MHEKVAICAKPRTIWVTAYVDYAAYAGFMQMNGTAISDDVFNVESWKSLWNAVRVRPLQLRCGMRRFDVEFFSLPLLVCMNEVPLSTCRLWRFAESFLKLQHSAAPARNEADEALSNSDAGIQSQSQSQRTHRVEFRSPPVTPARSKYICASQRLPRKRNSCRALCLSWSIVLISVNTAAL
jgi:hypothetical protein